jgi:23S rRNA pseudouridine2605 synthase
MAAQEYDPTDAPSEDGLSEGQDRVAKVLARAGVGSRREVERLIEAGRVAINGRVLTTPAVKVEPDDMLTVDGELISAAGATRVFRYHKPVGLVTTHSDPKGRPTVFQSLPEEIGRVISVGRLDLNSEGLLLLTNDGGLTRALELPSTGWNRIYRARAYGDTTQEKLNRLKDGITVEGVRYGPIDAKLDKASGRNIWITVTLAEGKNREVRRVLESLGLQVNRLLRLAYGPFSLGTLAPGHVEEVGPRVIRELLADHITPENMPVGNATEYKAPASAQTRRDPARAEAILNPVEKPEKPVYKEGWAKPKKKPVKHVMPKAAKTRVVADFGPGARNLKPKPFKSNAPKTDADRLSKTGKAPPARTAPPKDLRPKHFKDRDAPAPAPIAGEDAAIAAKARAFRLALEGLEDDRGPKTRSGPARSGPARSGPARPAASKARSDRTGPERSETVKSGPERSGPVRSGKPAPARGGRAPPVKAAAPRGKGHWFTAPGEAATTRPAPKGKAAPARTGAGPARSGARPIPRSVTPRAGKPTGAPKGRK